MRLLVIFVFALLLGSVAASASQKRCGWFENPTPGNAWLVDRHGEWTIGTQGGHQAKGDWPTFADDEWVKSNGNYGYGCACMDVVVNKASKKVLLILGSQVKPLSACQKDKALPKK